MPVTSESWNADVRCYHPDTHMAEVVVARELTRLAGRNSIKASIKGIDAWITKNEAATGGPRFLSAHTLDYAPFNGVCSEAAECGTFLGKCPMIIPI